MTTTLGRVLNATRQPDATVRELVRRGYRGTRDVRVHQSHRPRPSFTPDDPAKPLELCIAVPSAYPRWEMPRTDRNGIRAAVDSQIEVRSWREALVQAAAHEGYHANHRRRPSIADETHATRAGRDALLAYRRSR